MKRIPFAVLGLLLGCATATPPGASLPAVQPSPGRAEAMGKLAFMHGVWVGPASGTTRDGKPFRVTQAERIGPLLGGDILVVEGRGYRDDRSTAFNAFGVVSWDPQSGKYSFRTYAMGFAGTFDFTPTAEGYIWETPAGRDAVVRYTATVKDGKFREVGEYLAAGKPAVQTFEMNLQRVGDTDWPLGTPIPPTAGH